MQGCSRDYGIIQPSAIPIYWVPIYWALNVAVSSTHLIHYSQQVAKGFLWTPSGQVAAVASQNPTEGKDHRRAHMNPSRVIV